jgi:hypothetical protein
MIVSTIRYEDRSEPQSTEAPHGAGTSRSAVRTATGPDRRARGVTRTRERRAFANELARTPGRNPDGRADTGHSPTVASLAPRETATVAATHVAFACWRQPVPGSRDTLF